MACGRVLKVVSMFPLCAGLALPSRAESHIEAAGNFGFRRVTGANDDRPTRVADAVPSVHAPQQTAGKRTSRRREYAARVVGGRTAIHPASDGAAPDRRAVPAVGQIPPGAGQRAVPQGGRRLAHPPLPPARGHGRSGEARDAGQRHARGLVPHRALRRARDRARRGQAGRADAEPVLPRLCRRSGRGRRRAVLPQRDRRERLLPGDRRRSPRRS